MEGSSTIAELMERRRIQAGAKEYKGHTYMDLARFDEATKHKIDLPKRESVMEKLAQAAEKTSPATPSHKHKEPER